jgi:3-hydroxyacyl-[acyl-carrier-protein] dehydratase
VRFLLVDSIQELEPGKRAVGIKNVAMSEDFLADHFPERPIMPGMLIIESLVQLADWVLRAGSDFKRLGLASGFDRVKFRRAVRPGDQLRLEVHALSEQNGEVQFRGKAYRLDELVASATITLSVQPMDAYLEPDEARRVFGLLHPRGQHDAPNGSVPE